VEPEPISWRDEIEEGCECPVYLALAYRELMFARAMLEKGLLPLAGGWAEQPYYWVQAMEVIGAQAAQVERERIERMKAANSSEL
jgi:hypothetical protein